MSPEIIYINCIAAARPSICRPHSGSLSLPSIWKLHFLCLDWAWGLRSCLRDKGSCAFLGLLGTALLGALLHWQRSTPTLGLEVLAAPACPTLIAASNLKNTCGSGWILCSSSPALEGLCTEPAAEDGRAMLDARQKLLD